MHFVDALEETMLWWIFQ